MAEATAKKVFRNRIKELRMVRAADIDGAPWNWRTHPGSQREAMAGSLEELGIVDAIKTRVQDNGRLQMYDGHLRHDLIDKIGPETMIPCLVSDLTEDEAKKAILLLDPLSAMADTDSAKLASLLTEVETSSADLTRVMADMEAELQRALADQDGGLPEGQTEGPAGMDLEPHEHYDYVVILASTTQEWNLLLEKLDLKPAVRRGRLGTARAVRASRVLEKLP